MGHGFRAPSLAMMLASRACLGIQSQPLIWRGANGLLAVIHWALVTSALRAALKATLLEPVPLRFFLIPGGYASGVVSAFAALVTSRGSRDGLRRARRR